jgi:hypothetical protein
MILDDILDIIFKEQLYYTLHYYNLIIFYCD